MVINEAHGWVEVQGDRIWHRIDLGGAAAAIDERTSDSRPPHRPMSDPFEWPPSSESGSGQATAERGRHSGMRSAEADSSHPAPGSTFESQSPTVPSSAGQDRTPSTSSSRSERDRTADDTTSGPADER